MVSLFEIRMVDLDDLTALLVMRLAVYQALELRHLASFPCKESPLPDILLRERRFTVVSQTS